MPLEARYSVVKLSAWLLLAAMLAGLSLYLMFVLGPGWLVLLAAGVLFFGFASLGFLRCLIDRRVQLRIDAQGMMARAHSDATIPLRSLSGVDRRSNRLIFGLTKPAKYPVASRWRRFLLRINGAEAAGYFGDLWIWTAMLDRSQREILNAIHDCREPTAFEREMRAMGAAAKTDIVPFRL